MVGERCALAASSGLVNAAPDEASRRFLATQTLDEARHVEVFSQRLLDLGVRKKDFEGTIREHANPNLVRFAEILLEKVDKKDFVAGVVGQNVILEGMAFHVFEMMHAGNRALNPKFAHTLAGTIADERRHVGFGEARIGSLIREHPEKKPEIEKMQREMSYYMLATFADAIGKGVREQELVRMREAAEEAGAAPATWQGQDVGALEPQKLEALLADTVLKEFKARLDRIGIEYQTPVAAVAKARWSRMPLDVHDLDPEWFRERGRARFEFWFDSVQRLSRQASHVRTPAARRPRTELSVSETGRDRLDHAAVPTTVWERPQPSRARAASIQHRSQPAPPRSSSRPRPWTRRRHLEVLRPPPGASWASTIPRREIDPTSEPESLQRVPARSLHQARAQTGRLGGGACSRRT